MNANAFRHFYAYHFAQNRKLWDSYVAKLTDEQFTLAAAYSRGSVRDQVVHLIDTDEAWFTGLRGADFAEQTGLHDRAAIRAHWDSVEQMMRDYLAALRDEMLFEKPFPAGEDEALITWQVLIHVVNHGTDHRAQILRLLNDLGVETKWQDYIFYVYDNP